MNDPSYSICLFIPVFCLVLKNNGRESELFEQLNPGFQSNKEGTRVERLIKSSSLTKLILSTKVNKRVLDKIQHHVAYGVIIPTNGNVL